MKNFYFLFLSLILWINAKPQNSFEFNSAGSNTTITGFTQGPVDVIFYKNSPYTSTTFASTTTSVAFQLSNQQYTGGGISPGFGTGMGVDLSSTTTAVNTPRYVAMNAISSGNVDANHSAIPSPVSTGIALATNYAVSIFSTTNYLEAAGISTTAAARYHYSDLTLTFSSPVTNPVVHFVGLGGRATNASGQIVGFTTDLDLVAANTATLPTLSRLSGNSTFVVSASAITNTATDYTASTSSGAASGSALVTGSGITSLTFRLYIKSDRKAGNWTQLGVLLSGDRFLMGASLLAPVSLTGTVYNDLDGSSNGIANLSGVTNITGLNAVLVDANGNVVGTTAVSSTGTYTFPNVAANSSYTVLITTQTATVGSPAPAVTLPAGWVSTGEYNGTSTTSTQNDGNANGTSAVIAVGTTNVTNVNFGIEQAPNSNDVTAAAQINPGGTVAVQVPALTGTDYTATGTTTSMGTGNTIVIKTLPTNGTLYYNGVLVTAGQVITNYDPTKLTLDPNAGAISVSFTYAFIDAAGKEDPTPATVTMPFNTPAAAISGVVYVDASGMTGGVDGTAYTGGNLYANLLDASGNVIKSVPVSTTDGSYAFTDVANGDYNVQISSIQGTIGQPAPAQTLPGTYVNSSSTDATTPYDGKTPVSVVNNTSVTGVNFGIQTGPTAVNDALIDQGPGTVSLNILTNDSDALPGTINPATVSLVPPANASNITQTIINGITYITGFTVYDDPANPTVATGTWSVNSSGVVTYDPTNNYNNTAPLPINYTVRDNAGAISNQATITITYKPHVSLSGTVFNDNNGLNGGNTIDGTVTPLPTLYASLVDPATNTIVATVPVVDGSYIFENIAGNSNYNIVLTTNAAGSTAPSLPTGWFNTGEYVNSGAGSDLTANGILSVAVATTDITTTKFGINQPPTAVDNTAASTVNPGGTVSVAVPSTTFSGTDPNNGTVATMTITAFPSNATSITINGVTYTASSFPAAGITVPTNSTGNPTQAISVDPIDGAVSVQIPYTLTDIAGLKSAAATATIPFTGLTISGTVYNDNDAGTPDGTAYTTGSLYANLIGPDGKVWATTPISTTDGTYAFTDLSKGSYTVQLSSTQGTVGQLPPASSLPFTYEYVSATDATVTDGNTDASLTTVNVTGVNFGINQPPLADNKTNTLIDQTSTTPVTLTPNNSSPILSGSDPNGGSIVTYDITSLPTNGYLYLNGVQVTSLAEVQGLTSADFATLQYVVDNTNPGVTNGATQDQFTYTVTDNAGLTSNEATYVIPFQGALPIELLSFEGSSNGCNTILNWATAGESHFSHFEIERSADGVHFIKLGEMTARGSNSLYRFTDASASKITYYRLKMVDLDAKYAYSEVISVRGTCEKISITPTLAHDFVYINGQKGGESVKIYAFDGKLLIDGILQQGYDPLSISKLPVGVYLLTISKDGQIIKNEKVIKQ